MRAGRETRGLGFGGVTSAAFRRVGDVPVVSRFPVAVGDRARDPGGDDPQHDRDPATELPVGDEHDEPDAAGQRDEHPARGPASTPAMTENRSPRPLGTPR